MVFYDIFQQKKRLSRLKNKKFKKAKKIRVFPKRLRHGFSPKMVIFPAFFFLGSIGEENVFNDILEGKIAFLGYKNNKFKKYRAGKSV